MELLERLSICKHPSLLSRCSASYIARRSSSCRLCSASLRDTTIPHATHELAEHEPLMEGTRESFQHAQAQLKPVDPITKRYDDMQESYGEAYATRSADEGFGGTYSAPLNVPHAPSQAEAKNFHPQKNGDVAAVKEPQVQDFDRTQGSPVAEKEKSSRHGTGFTGC